MSRPTREEMEEQLVELLQTASASEAERLAAGLRQRGIIAVANAEAMPLAKGRRGMQQPFRTFVLVHETDLDAATAAIDEVMGTEGEVPDEQIRAEMIAAEEDPDAATAWYYEKSPLKQKLPKILASFWFVLAAGVVGYLLIRSFQ